MKSIKILSVMVLLALAACINSFGQSAGQGPITLLTASADATSPSIDVSKSYYHAIEFSSFCTNGATSIVAYIQGSFSSPGTTTNYWANIQTNTVATNNHAIWTFNGPYKYIRVKLANTVSGTQVGTNYAWYFGKPL